MQSVHVSINYLEIVCQLIQMHIQEFFVDHQGKRKKRKLNSRQIEFFKGEFQDAEKSCGSTPNFKSLLNSAFQKPHKHSPQEWTYPFTRQITEPMSCL